MFYKEKESRPKDGYDAFLWSPSTDDTENMFQLTMKASGETDFPMKFPKGFTGSTLDQEKAFLQTNCDNKGGLTVIYLIDGRTAGSCQISFRTEERDRHRASVAIVLLRELWNLGIGTRIFEEMFQTTGERSNIHQIELDFIEGNKRARGLCEKMEFRTARVKPDAIRMKGGSFANEYMMVERLQHGGILVRCLNAD